LTALQEFHDHKQAILDEKACIGNKLIDSWKIPKIELSQSVVPNTKVNGAIFQWTANVTEHEHIPSVKDWPLKEQQQL